LEKQKYLANEAISESVPHVTFEGLPGYVNYIYNSVLGIPTFKELLRNPEAESSIGLPGQLARAGLFAGGLGGLTALSGAAKEKLLGDGDISGADVRRGLLTGAGAGAGFMGGKFLSNRLIEALAEKYPSLKTPGVSSLSASVGLPLLATLGGGYLGRKLSQSIDKPKKKKRGKDAKA
jgi:hypothetical protein